VHRLMLPLATALILNFGHGDAQARMLCDGDYQLVAGLPVATPYCRELNLARVAHSYGIRVPVEAIRYSQSARSDVCRAIGSDNRVQEICAPYRNGFGSGGGVTR
jgi:hypothetical protein